MYPYFYPSYPSPAKPNAHGAMPPMTGTPTVPPMQPEDQVLPPVLGKTPGPPVEPTPPAPVTMQPPQVTEGAEPPSPVIGDTNYTQGYLRTQIGKQVRVEFLIGTGMFTDRVGTLVGVGISYILIQPAGTDDIMLCDIYSIKFVTFFR